MAEKTLKERLDEARGLYEQLFAMGFTPDQPGIAAFRSVANRFVKTGEGESGEVRLTGFKRVLVYKMSATRASTVVLRYEPHA